MCVCVCMCVCVRVCVTLVIQHALHRRRIILPSMTCPRSTLFFHTISRFFFGGGGTSLNIKCMFLLSLQPLSKRFKVLQMVRIMALDTTIYSELTHNPIDIKCYLAEHLSLCVPATATINTTRFICFMNAADSVKS